MPTWNHADNVDALTMVNHAFVKELWDNEKGKALRDTLFKFKHEDLGGLLGFLNKRGFKITPGVQIILVDIEGVQTKNFPEEINKQKPFYFLVLPPVPTKAAENGDEYKAHQTSVEALFHASNDGYGM
jgi:hypothetical protein